MKTRVFKLFSLIIFFLITANCQPNLTQTNSKDNFPTNESVLEFYRQYSSFTDPGEYAYLYKDLPNSLPELCSIIKSQYINLYALGENANQIPRERLNEMIKYPTVKLALEGLLSYSKSGLVKDRKPENRLILICRDNAILLASILKSRGIPARVRYGFAPYLMPGFHATHVICEVWNEKENRWMLVDPTMDKVDFSRDEFDLSNDAWQKMQKKEIDANLYGIPGRHTGMLTIAMLVCGDLASILGTEHPTFHYPPMLDQVSQNNNQLNTEQIETLNNICELMNSLDDESLSELQEIYNNTPEIQMTKSFDMTSRQKH